MRMWSPPPLPSSCAPGSCSAKIVSHIRRRSCERRGRPNAALAVQVYGPRYYFEATGALALLSARGLAQLARLVALGVQRAGLEQKRARLAASSSVLLLVTPLTAVSFGGFAPRQFRHYARFYNIDGSGVRVVEAAHLHRAVVFVASNQDPYAWPDLAAFFSDEPVTLDGDVVYAADLGDRWDAALLRSYPGRASYHFKAGRLTPLALP